MDFKNFVKNEKFGEIEFNEVTNHFYAASLELDQ